MMSTWIGLDVSKDTIEVCLLRESGKEHFKQFPNDGSGHSIAAALGATSGT